MNSSRKSLVSLAGIGRYGAISALIWALSAFPVETQAAPESAARELKTIEKRYRDYYRGMVSKPEDVQKAVAMMRLDGSYPDLDYTARDSVNLPCFPHLQRLGDMTAAYRDPLSPLHGKPEIKAQISRGLDYWLTANPRSGNWWYNDIGTPNALAKILFLFESELSIDQRSRGIAILKNGYTDGRCVFGKLKVAGQNLLWIADLLIQAGCLEENYDFAAKAAQAAAAGIQIEKGAEGIQPDFSFHQHGRMLYSGGYGKAFPVSVLQIAAQLQGTSLAFPPEKVDMVSRYLFDGQQWMIRGTMFDFGTIGRAIARQREGANAGQIARALRLLSTTQPGLAAKADIFAKRVQGKVPPGEDVVSGNRMFWNSDYMSQQQPGYFLGIKAVSTRTIGSESGNREALKNYHMSTGVTCLMKTGKEYEGIFPLWNWRMLPGITCALSDAPIREINWGKGSEGTRTFTGGASDGKHGVMGYDFNRDGVAARKAWFCFDDAIVCLGAGVQSDSVDSVVTTIEQNWHQAPVLFGRDETSTRLTAGAAADLENARWLLHGTTGYYFPVAQKVQVQIEHRTGSWRDIGKDESPAPVNGDVFSAWINHGAAPQNGAYQYIVLPNTSEIEIASYKFPVILANNTTQQAVWDGRLKILEAVFYEPSIVTLPAGYGTLAVDKPCILTARDNGLSWTISLADPSQTLERVTVTLRNKEVQTSAFNLPTGDDAGRTATQVMGKTVPATELTALMR